MAEDENVCPQAWGGRAGCLARELRRLRAPPGVTLLPPGDRLDRVAAVIEGPASTPYAGGSFAVRLELGPRYPLEAPRAVFETRVFHPNVCRSGRVCVDTLARGWRPALGLAHALLALRCLLIAPNPDSALNADAAALMRDHYDAYFARAKLYTEIHARPPPAPPCGAGASPEAEAEADAEAEAGPSAKRERHAPPAAAKAPSKAPARDKRRILKRL